MSTFFTIAADFLDRMVNPEHGVLVNQDYSLQFAELLTSEEDSIDRMLRHEAKGLADADVLSANGWIWFLTWARSEQIPLREDLLLELSRKWSSVFIQTLVIDIALQDSDQSPNQRVSISQIDHAFLQKLLLDAVKLDQAKRDEQRDFPEDRTHDEIRIGRAKNTLVALLEVDSDLSLAAAGALLRHEWRGQRRLLEFYKTLEMGLDPEARREWNERFRY